MKKLMIPVLFIALALSLTLCIAASAEGGVPLEQPDITGCDTFTQIVDRKLSDGMGYANATIAGKDVLLVSNGTFDTSGGAGEPFQAAIDAWVYCYDGYGGIECMGYVAAGGTAYPLAVADGLLYVGNNHGVARLTVDAQYGFLTVDQKAWVEYDGNGGASYFQITDISDKSGGTRTLPDDTVLNAFFEDYNRAEVIEFNRVSK